MKNRDIEEKAPNTFHHCANPILDIAHGEDFFRMTDLMRRLLNNHQMRKELGTLINVVPRIFLRLCANSQSIFTLLRPSDNHRLPSSFFCPEDYFSKVKTVDQEFTQFRNVTTLLTYIYPTLITRFLNPAHKSFRAFLHPDQKTQDTLVDGVDGMENQVCLSQNGDLLENTHGLDVYDWVKVQKIFNEFPNRWISSVPFPTEYQAYRDFLRDLKDISLSEDLFHILRFGPSMSFGRVLTELKIEDIFKLPMVGDRTMGWMVDLKIYFGNVLWKGR